jgi:hypothetical protein
MKKNHKSTNKLINETSPYLLQHAHNPVQWYPWGEEAFRKAKKENKPIFLSIGYAACHWCHVMERESFENREIARFLNKHFVPIKVDREERPDLDEIYMAAVLAVSGSGGWPMTVFLTPELKPFFGGTYFPPEDRFGRVGFKRLILRISELWANGPSRGKFLQDADQLRDIICRRTSSSPAVEKKAELTEHLLVSARKHLADSFDDRWGGFSGAPKFPPSNAISFLLRNFHHTGNRHSLDMVSLTLDKMYEGGMYDHLAGGFHRYSVDHTWLVPHFEKMLYDNAQLAVVYLEAYQVTGRKRYARIAGEIFDYVLAYMTDSNGAFFSTEDADSEGKEGFFYLWKSDELDELLGQQDAEIFSRYYSLKKSGNFTSPEPYHKEQNILFIRQDADALAEEFRMTENDLEEKLSSIRQKLLKARDKRLRPGLDDKVITSWNALMISALSRGYQVLDHNRYLQAAEKSAAFLMAKMRTANGTLLRIFRNGQSKYPAYLEDYAYTIRSFIDLYEAGFNEKWLFAAENLTGEMIALFWEKKENTFFNTNNLHKNLIVRTKTASDGATPSPLGVAAEVLLRLHKLLDKKSYLSMAQRLLKSCLGYMERLPQGYLTLLMAVGFLVYPPKEIAITGKKNAEDTKKLLQAVHSRFVPHRVIAFLDPDQENAAELSSKIPFLSGRGKIDGHAAAYVCENSACRLPVSSPASLLEQLK